MLGIPNSKNLLCSLAVKRAMRITNPRVVDSIGLLHLSQL